jgi:mannose-1-phosphate guanylyltransferase
MLYAVLMAGGSGTRFWPASRNNLPKQLLALTGAATMIQATADRLGDSVPPSRCLVITNRRLVPEVKAQLPGVSVIGEPCRRDTAPCIGLAAAVLAASDPDAVMLVMPTDHVILNRSAFAKSVHLARDLIEEDSSRIITFGIPPTYPAESFGYIERGQMIGDPENHVFSVARFREKPNRGTAEEFVESGNFLWNSGIFVWRAETILALLRKYQPEMARHIDLIGSVVGTADFDRVLEVEFEKIAGKSIDYAVMERHDNVVVIQAPFDWDDVGSWQAIARLQPLDPMGNAVKGRHIGVETRDSIVQGSDDHLIVTIDVENLIIVHTADATLVAPKSSEERVRNAVKEIESRGWTEYL